MKHLTMGNTNGDIQKLTFHQVCLSICKCYKTSWSRNRKYQPLEEHGHDPDVALVENSQNIGQNHNFRNDRKIFL